jgi:hypothetical protein
VSVQMALECETTYPALAANEVAGITPLDVVAAAFAHGVLSIPTAIAPPRKKVAIVVAFLVLSGLAGDQGRVAFIALAQEVKWRAQGTCRGRQGQCGVFEGNHGCCFVG